MTRALAVLAIAAAACNGKPRAEEARSVPQAAGARPVAADAAPGAIDAAPAPGAPPATGDLQVRVEWPDVPVAARSSPGRTPCNTPRAPSVAPTTTWGIPDALVIVDGAAPPSRLAQVTLADCAPAPRIVVGSSLAVTSAVDHPARLVLRKRGTVDQLGDGDAIPIMLPIAGHTVTAALDAGAIYSLETTAGEPELAFIAALPNAYVSDAGGHVVIRDLAVGSHAVTAWLPPRAGQPARRGRATATVSAGDLAEVTATLAP